VSARERNAHAFAAIVGAGLSSLTESFWRLLGLD